MRVADRMEDETFTAIEADTEVPVLPGDLVTFNAISGTCRLHDIERCGRRPELGQQVGRSRAAPSGQGEPPPPRSARPFSAGRSGNARASRRKVHRRMSKRVTRWSSGRCDPPHIAQARQSVYGTLDAHMAR